MRIDRDLCTGCWDCVEVCPTSALETKAPGAAAGGPEAVPRILGRLCVSCGACVTACGPGAVSFRSRASI